MKKFICLTLAFIMLISLSAQAGELLGREDIPILSEECHEAASLVKLGILKGTGQALELDRNMTRAEAAAMLCRMLPEVDFYTWQTTPYKDIDKHWAKGAVEKLYNYGAKEDAELFRPDEYVTGKVFLEWLIKTNLFYYDKTADIYDLGVEYGVLKDNFTKSVVYNDLTLTRGDAVRICYSALLAKTNETDMLYESLIKHGAFKASDFEGMFTEEDAKASFADRLSTQMPKDKNYMFSPLSIKTAFAMAANGADGETKEEILKALGIEDLDEFNGRIKKLIKDYAESDLTELNISNSIWLNESNTDQKFSEEFSSAANDCYNAEARTVSDETAVESINAWVKDATNGKIPGIISQSDFGAALINAVYFKGAWECDFSESATKKGEFTSRDGSVKEIDYMHQTDYFRLYNEGENVLIELPYKSYMEAYDEETGEEKRLEAKSAVSMYLIMGDCENAEKLIENAKTEYEYIKLSMPKFKIEYETDLKGIMNALGVNKAFSEDAEFERMFDKGTMFMDKALHKTYIDVDEKGTEAAAVTALMFAKSALPPEPVEITFDKPFKFVIKDKTNNEILFMGEYAYAQ